MTSTFTELEEQGAAGGPVVALSADIVDYSRLMADDMPATVAAMDDYHRLVDEKVAESGGVVANFVGDSFMAVFDDAEDAMQSAIAITTAVADRNVDVREHERVRFRMGLDRGEVVVTPNGKYHGDALNIAARIQAIALPGGVSASGAVYRALDEPALRFRSIGSKRLKNIPEQVQVYQFVDLPADNAARSAPGRSLALERPSVAVLPIHIEGLEPDLVQASGLLVADLVHGLVQMQQLDVVDVSRTDAIPETAAQDSAVRYMLQTGVHHMGDQVRVYASLIETASINVVWSHRWQATQDTVFGLLDEVTADVVRAFEIELVVGEPARIYAEFVDAAALVNVYQGWFHLTTGTKRGWQRSIELFAEVGEAHPEAMVGTALLAFARWYGASRGLADDPVAELVRARADAERTAALGDDTGLSNMVLAAICLDEGDPDLALEQAEAAIINRPTCDVTFAVEASVRRYLGQWEQAVDLVDQAMGLSPVGNPWYATILASSYYVGERYEDAAATAEAVLAHQPHNLEALLILAAAQAELGLDRRAGATATLVRERFPSTSRELWLEKAPYQDPEFVERWRRDLAAAGLE